MARFFWICLSGAAGTGARYLLSAWITRLHGPGFPFGTLTVNVVGSFLLGALMQVAVAAPELSPTLRLALTTGFVGGFTTYSSFNHETLELLATNAPLGALNLAATLGTCLLSGILGGLAGRLLLGR